MLHNIAADPPSQMDMIDSLQRLGVAYHFEEEITESLSKLNENTLSDHGDLNATALRFRLLRQHRYYVSCGNPYTYYLQDIALKYCYQHAQKLF